MKTGTWILCVREKHPVPFSESFYWHHFDRQTRPRMMHGNNAGCMACRKSLATSGVRQSGKRDSGQLSLTLHRSPLDTC